MCLFRGRLDTPAAKQWRHPSIGHYQIALYTEVLTRFLAYFHCCQNKNKMGSHLQVCQVSIFYEGQFPFKVLHYGIIFSNPSFKPWCHQYAGIKDSCFGVPLPQEVDDTSVLCPWLARFFPSVWKLPRDSQQRFSHISFLPWRRSTMTK